MILSLQISKWKFISIKQQPKEISFVSILPFSPVWFEKGKKFKYLPNHTLGSKTFRRQVRVSIRNHELCIAEYSFVEAIRYVMRRTIRISNVTSHFSRPKLKVVCTLQSTTRRLQQYTVYITTQQQRNQKKEKQKEGKNKKYTKISKQQKKNT